MSIAVGARLDPWRVAAGEPTDWLVSAAKGLLVSAASIYLLIYVVIACLRIGYPYELEWMEGGSVDHVRRILAGLPLYAQPTLDFTAYIYTPLYWYVSAAVSVVLGVGFLPLRLVSLTASLGCFYVLYRFVRRETRSATWALVSAGLYAATYRASGAWFDLARVDSLAMFFLLTAIYQVRFGQRVRQMILAGVLLALAFMTKQTTLMVAVPLTLYCLVAKDRRASLAMACTWIALVVASTMLMNAATHGWYNYYIFVLPGNHELLSEMWRRFWTIDLIPPMGLAMLVTIYCLYTRMSLARWRHLLFYVALGLGMIASAWLSRVHIGGYDNVLQPAYAFLAIGSGVGAGTWQRRWRKQPARDGRLVHQGHPWIRLCLRVGQPLLLYGLLIGQFHLLYYPPRKQVPTRADLRAGNAFMEFLRSIKTDVFVPDTGFLPSLAGQQPHAQRMAMEDVLQAESNDPVRNQLMAEVRKAIIEKRFSVIILQKDYWHMNDLKRNYVFKGAIFPKGARFWPVTGQRTRPSLLYVAKGRKIDLPELPIRVP